MYVQTYSNYPSAEVSSAFQKSVRRGHLDAIHWALELYWTDQPRRTNIWNRLLVTSVEDIGPANPELILHVIALCATDPSSQEWTEGNSTSLARAVELCVKSQKCRLNDLLAGRYDYSRGVPPQMAHIDPKVAAEALKQALKDKRIESALCWAEYLWRTPHKIGNKRAGWLLWEALDVCTGLAKELRPTLEILGMSPNWRWQEKTRLLWIHLIVCQCFELNRPSLPNRMPIDELLWTLEWTRCKGFHPSGPEYAIDKHTLRGKAMGRGTEHFMKEGSVITNTVPELEALQGMMGLV